MIAAYLTPYTELARLLQKNVEAPLSREEYERVIQLISCFIKEGVRDCGLCRKRGNKEPAKVMASFDFCSGCAFVCLSRRMYYEEEKKDFA